MQNKEMRPVSLDRLYSSAPAPVLHRDALASSSSLSSSQEVVTTSCCTRPSGARKGDYSLMLTILRLRAKPVATSRCTLSVHYRACRPLLRDGGRGAGVGDGGEDEFQKRRRERCWMFSVIHESAPSCPAKASCTSIDRSSVFHGRQ